MKSYTYDKSSRLTGATIGSDTFAYEFGAQDASCDQGVINPNAHKNSNRTKLTKNGQVTTTYCYDYADRLIASSDQRFNSPVYDSHGNITSLGGAGNQTTFEYDASDRNMATAETVGGVTSRVVYGRDAGDRIVTRMLTENGTTKANEKHVYNGSSAGPAALVGVNDEILAKYISLPGGVSVKINPQSTSAGATTYSLSNIHGDIMATVNADGALTIIPPTGPFGEVLQNTVLPQNAENGSSYTYVGRHQKITETSFSTGFIQMGARVYLQEPIAILSIAIYNKTMTKSTAHSAKEYQFGLDSFGDLPVNEKGKLATHPEAIRQLVEEAVLADTLGVDVIALGEHHRADYSISSPEMVLAGIAGKTKNIKLSSGVTVLSSDDPVRVFQRFATLDALSNGRAQVILGRGSFTESFPLFGYNLQDYNVLFEEKINLFAELLKEGPVTWEGTTRAALNDADVYPKTASGHLETFVGVGGSPESIIRAAKYNFPVMLAIIGGAPDRFKPYVTLYQRASEELGHTPHPVGMHSPGYIAETDEQAIKEAFPYFKEQMDRIGKTRGWPPLRREQFLHEVKEGSLYVGSPETVANKIARAMKVLGVNRFDLVYGFGPVPAKDRLRLVELYATKVIPRVRELLSEGEKTDGAAHA